MTKKKNRKRREGILLMLDERELFLLNRNVAKAGFTNRQAYMRMMLLAGVAISLNPDEIKALSFEIKQIGINLNQIAKKANLVGKAGKSEIESAISEWRSVKTLLDKFTNLHNVVS